MTTARTVVYPGSFDPVTNGHIDIVRRAGHLFDHVIVAVTGNPSKDALFTIPERLSMLRLVLGPLVQSGKVSVDSFRGLLVDYCSRRGATAVVRGLRALSDFEYEFRMALMNRHLAPGLETIFLMSDEKFTFLSSTLLKDVARLGGDAGRFVPPALVPRLRRKFRRR